LELRPEQLVDQISTQALAPVYLITGPEPLRVLEAADAVRKQARAEGINERAIFQADARDFDWRHLAASFQTPSLFSQRRLLELRLPSAKPGKDGAQVISDFCAQPPNDVVLLITGEQWSRNHQGKWSHAISRMGVMAVAWAIKPHELTDWIQRRLRRNGLRADMQAIQYLAERVEGNLLAAAQEIDKLALLTDGTTLDLPKMQALVADSARYDVFRLAEVTLSGQVQTVQRILTGLRSEGEMVPALLPIVVRELLLATHFAKIQASGGNLASEMKNKGIWEARQAPFKQALQRHPNVVRWEYFMAWAAHIDALSKGRSQGDPWQALERLLLAIAHPPALKLVARSRALV